LRRLSAAAAAVLLVASSLAPAADETVEDQWFAVFQGGAKTGWSHTRRARSPEGWVTEFEELLIRAPGGEKMAKPIHLTSQFVEDGTGRPCSA
jgi:hypothetical protein